MNESVHYSQIKQAKVFVRDNLAGILTKKSDQEYIFSYDVDWIEGKKGDISFSLPCSQTPYTSRILFPFFDNLIPEGWLLAYVEQIQRIDTNNRFALLLATGHHTIGAISIVPISDSNLEIHPYQPKLSSTYTTPILFESVNNRCSYCLNTMGKSDVNRGGHIRCIRSLWGTTRKLNILLDETEPLEVFRHTIYGASISGAQRKGLFELQGNTLIPATGHTAAIILKPQGDFPSLPENEHVTMSIAKKLGFTVPPCGIFEVPQLGKVFAIRRFDRNSTGQWLRMEDFGQILDETAANKYSKSYNQIAKAIHQYSDARKVDIIDFWRRLLFSFFIGNGDMHLKNWAMLEKENLDGSFRLSPCYDFLNTRLPLPREKFDLAIPMDARQNKLNRSRFLTFAKKLNIEDEALQILTELSTWLTVTREFVAFSFLSSIEKARYLEIVEERYAQLL
jgi:serine/threonine-protein kinase HipA